MAVSVAAAIATLMRSIHMKSLWRYRPHHACSSRSGTTTEVSDWGASANDDLLWAAGCNLKDSDGSVTRQARRHPGRRQSDFHEYVRVLFEQVAAADIDELRDFLGEVDLTLSGLDAPTVKLWTEHDPDGSIIGSTGYELSPDGAHALIRSVAVAPGRHAADAGSRLAMFAISDATRSGAPPGSPVR